MIARELPSAEVLASWQHVEQRALDLRAAGIPGTLEELRVRAYLDLLQERRTASPCLAPARLDAGHGRAAGHRPGRKRRRPGRQRSGRPGGVGPANGPGGSGSGGRPARMPGPAWPRWSTSPCRGPR